MDGVLLDPFVRLLREVSPPAAVRRAEVAGDAADILRAINESGFLDALLPEEKAGSGLALTDVIPLFFAAAESLLPVPFADTMLARAWIVMAGGQAPADRAIVLWPTTPDG